MSTLNIQKVVLAGLSPTYGEAAVGGDEFVNSGREFIHVKNGHTSPQTVTVNSQAVCSQGFDHDVAVEILASGERMIGPFPKDRFDDTGGKVQITYSGVTLLTIAAIQVA